MNMIKKIKQLFFKEKPKRETFGIEFGDGNYVGQVVSYTDVSINGQAGKTTHLMWSGREWIDPTNGGPIYTHKQINKEDFITKPGEFPWRMHDDDYQRYRDAMSKP